MALNVRNEHTLDALRELSRITGSPMTTELDCAVTERLERLRRRRVERLARLAAICADAADRWPEDQRTDDLTAGLYDDRGLPA